MARDYYSDFDGKTEEEIVEYLGEPVSYVDMGWGLVEFDSEGNEMSYRRPKGGGKKKKDNGASKKIAALPEIPKCRHYFKVVELPNGLTVQASSLDWGTRPERRLPDFGLYCDYAWHPDWRAEFINWPDYKTPRNHEAAADAIIEAYGRACEGWRVETGCIGGHGRTGTVLACWSVLAGLTPVDAMAYVWENYCKEAIESKAQVRFIEWFAQYAASLEG